ncbi:MAG: hypothetical protein LBJ64_09830 [Deltaproteobacteria bacterium]|nr:hypothetical protein [Deltaproteobacteria bacterium]
MAAIGEVRGETEEFCKKVVSLAKSLIINPANYNNLALVVCSVYNFLKDKALSSILGKEANMLEMLDALSGGKYSQALTIT